LAALGAAPRQATFAVCERAEALVTASERVPIAVRRKRRRLVRVSAFMHCSHRFDAPSLQRVKAAWTDVPPQASER
jgi:hypothetical protein